MVPGLPISEVGGRRPMRKAAKRPAKARVTPDYLSVGRVNQKLRTRAALVAVAADFIREGKTFSVTDIADTARVSRTTAYRYFPTHEMLAAQATLVMAGSIDTDHIDQLVRGPGSPAEKVDAAIVASDTMTGKNEAMFRSVLRLSAEPPSAAGDVPRRPNYRRGWFANAIASLKEELGDSRFRQLVGALCLCSGIESTVVLQDICAMKPAEARQVKRWAGQLLLKGALAEAAGGAAVKRRA
ncbi:MAG: TetR/AcrR family transcriptional regulator [Alphaproteobacteria bacterium]|nr:TetR/AcrR family transcriptional regulator [Alphaproteobacteria bacterium]